MSTPVHYTHHLGWRFSMGMMGGIPLCATAPDAWTSYVVKDKAYVTCRECQALLVQEILRLGAQP